jgi:regulator of RNase E activity RraA
LVARLEALDTCVLSDALEALGRNGAIGGITPRWDCGRIAGRATTVLLRRLAPDEQHAPGPHLGARAIEAAEPGDIVVVAHGGRSDSAGWGGLLSAAAAAAGVRGCLVDGACRDVDDAVALGFPLFARSATPATARRRTVEQAVGVPVPFGEVTVHPGDYVVADRSGVVVIPAGIAEDVAAEAEHMHEQELRMLAALRDGEPVTKVMDRRYEDMIDRGR